MLTPSDRPKDRQGTTRQAPAMHHLRTYLTFLRYPEELKTHKTAWEYYNESK